MESIFKSYLNQANDYGCPSTKAINFFLDNMYRHIKSGEIIKMNELELDLYWITNHCKSEYAENNGKYRGGYSFYKYITEKAKSYNYDKEKIKEAILNYKIPEQNCEEDLKQLIIDKNIQYRLIYSFVRPEIESGLICIDANKKCLIYPENIEVDLGNVDINGIAYDKAYINELCSFIITPKNYMGNFKLYKIYRSLMGYEEYNPYGKLFGNNTSNTIEEANHSKESDKADSVEYANKAGEADTSNAANTSSNSNIANELSSEYEDELYSKYKNYLIPDLIGSDEFNDNLIDVLREKNLETYFTYNTKEYESEFNTKDIYSSEVIKKAKDTLVQSHRVCITGNTGDGKTQLALLIAHDITNKNIRTDSDDPNNCKYEQVYIVNASECSPLYRSDKDKGIPGALEVFDRHVREYNKKHNINEDAEDAPKFIFICNEIQRVDAAYLLGDLWEDFSNNAGSNYSSKLAHNIRLIFTGCRYQDFGIDSQIIERLYAVDLGYLDTDDKGRHNKIVSAFNHVPNVEGILNCVESINHTAGMQIVSFRKFNVLLDSNKCEKALSSIKESIAGLDGKTKNILSKTYEELEDACILNL